MKIKNFWHSKINWKNIENELNKYPYVKKTFSINILKKSSENPPFFCHPIVRWFLYNDPSPLRVLDNIFKKLQSVCGIDEKIKYLRNPKNESFKFWSTLSELSLALYLQGKRKEVILLEETTTPQPDIKIKLREKDLFFEVYTHHKFYYMLHELMEILDERLEGSNLQPFYRTHKYSKDKRVKLNEREILRIAQVCSNRLDNIHYKNKFQREYQTEIYENDEKTLCVYIENKNNFDPESYVPSEYERVDENAYFKVMLEEMIHEKNRQLKDKHPNTLAVNILFNQEWQTIKWNRLKIPSVSFYDIDSIVFFTNTIDSEEIIVKMEIVNPSVQNRDGLCKIIDDTTN